MSFNLVKFINSVRGKYVLSILLGLGLATLFRKACNARDCLVFKAPDIDKIKDKVFNHNKKCYEFRSESTKCSKANVDGNILLEM